MANKNNLPYINKITNPKGLKKDQYDVIIIGAGIGGLVCGCYLARAGLKVLIVEQHNKPGGYCTSFERGRFIFQAGAIEDLNNGSFFRKIIEELEIEEKVKIGRKSPHILIFTENEKVKVGIDDEVFIDLKEKFPSEATQIEKFYKLIKDYNIFLIYRKYWNRLFDDLLDEYFKDEKLKNILRIISSIIGLSSNKVSALSIITYYKTFILGGGYYPIGGLQKFSDSFAERFKEFGGNLILSKLVKKIIVKDNKAEGIVLSSGEKFYAKFIVSNADATKTFLELVGEEYLSGDFILKIKNLIPSISAFIFYLGINKKLKDKFDYTHQIWYIPTFKIDDPFDLSRLESKDFELNIYCYSPSFGDDLLCPADCETMSFGILTPFINDEYWRKNRIILEEKITEKMKKIIPFSDENIVVKETATPNTLYKYTLNREGACKGWAPLISQVEISTMPFKTPIDNLFLASHWVTSGVGEVGVPHSAYTGYNVFQAIYKKILGLKKR